MQVSNRSIEYRRVNDKKNSPVVNITHFSTAVFQQNVYVLLVFEMLIKVHYVFMMKNLVQLDLSVDLVRKIKHRYDKLQPKL